MVPGYGNPADYLPDDVHYDILEVQIQSILTLRHSAGFHVPIMESSHHCCQRFFIFDERLPVLVSVFIHPQEIRKLIVRQVIYKIAITGHHPRSIRHIERGARLLRLFAELGNLFPSSSFFQPLITDSTSRPLHFGKFLSNNALIVSFRRRLGWFCQGSQSALRFHRIYLLLRRWMSLCFQPLKPVIHFGSRDLGVLLRGPLVW